MTILSTNAHVDACADNSHGCDELLRDARERTLQEEDGCRGKRTHGIKVHGSKIKIRDPHSVFWGREGNCNSFCSRSVTLSWCESLAALTTSQVAFGRTSSFKIDTIVTSQALGRTTVPDRAAARCESMSAGRSLVLSMRSGTPICQFRYAVLGLRLVMTLRSVSCRCLRPKCRGIKAHCVVS